MSLSNKNLALLLVVAIVISIGGTIVSINKFSQIQVGRPVIVTGKATDLTGEVNLTIKSNASCNIDANVVFGSDVSRDADIDTDTDNSATSNFTNCVPAASACRGLVVNNTGNVVLNITFNSSVNGSTFLGGTETDAQFRYFIDETEEEAGDGCVTPGASAWTDVPETENQTVCRGLNYSAARDTITIEFNVNITTNTPTGLKQSVIEVGCEQE